MGEKAWNKTLDWVNSGQSLVDYSKKHGKFMPCAKNQKDVSMESKNVQNTPEIESKCPKNEGIQEDRKKDALIDAKIQNRIHC